MCGHTIFVKSTMPTLSMPVVNKKWSLKNQVSGPCIKLVLLVPKKKYTKYNLSHNTLCVTTAISENE